MWAVSRLRCSDARAGAISRLRGREQKRLVKFIPVKQIAAGCAVASFGTFFSMPWRMLPFPIAVGMLGHAARWALISLAAAMS
jgi:hypothetical protein